MECGAAAWVACVWCWVAMKLWRPVVRLHNRAGFIALLVVCLIIESQRSDVRRSQRKTRKMHKPKKQQQPKQRLLK